MKRTKLEEYISILQILQMHGPTHASDIKNLIHIEAIDLKEALSFLLEQNAIEENPSNPEPAFAATPLGTRIVKYFGFNAFMKKPFQ